MCIYIYICIYIIYIYIYIHLLESKIIQHPDIHGVQTPRLRKSAACFALLRGKVYEAMENLELGLGKCRAVACLMMFDVAILCHPWDESEVLGFEYHIYVSSPYSLGFLVEESDAIPISPRFVTLLAPREFSTPVLLAMWVSRRMRCRSLAKHGDGRGWSSP